MDQNEELLRSGIRRAKHKSGHQNQDHKFKFGGDSESGIAFGERSEHNNHNLLVSRTKATDA
jgi:hypothetical protein